MALNGPRARSFRSGGDGGAPRSSPRSCPSQTEVTHQQRRHRGSWGRLRPGEGMRPGQRGRHRGDGCGRRGGRLAQTPAGSAGQTGGSNSPVAGWRAASLIPQRRGRPSARAGPGGAVQQRSWPGCPGPSGAGRAVGRPGRASRPWPCARSRPPEDLQPLAPVLSSPVTVCHQGPGPLGDSEPCTDEAAW